MNRFQAFLRWSPPSSSATPPTPAEPAEWKFCQMFGATNRDDLTEADIVTTVEFDSTGEFFAAGDKGGRIVIFERQQPSKEKKAPCYEYKYYTEFQSHEPEFDYLKSLEIEEKINKIKWLKNKTGAMMLLSTNDKTTKLWKVHPKKIKVISNLNIEKKSSPAIPYASSPVSPPSSPSLNGSVPLNTLRVPRITVKDNVMAAQKRRVFANAHAYNINSIAVNPDDETFISVDDLRINLWHLERHNESFNIVDIKPANMEDLTEVITSGDFHPTQCNIFLYSTSKGVIKLSDMRKAALCDSCAKPFEAKDDGAKSFFTDIISSISDAKFTKDGRYIISRDYLTVKLWDINMEHKPVKVFQVHDYVKPKLCDLYENDCIFDKFEVTASGNGNYVMTGTYGNMFHVMDKNGKNDAMLEASQAPATVKRRGSLGKIKSLGRSGGKKDKKNDPSDVNVDGIDFDKKILHVAWHPTENLVAAATKTNLFLFNA